MVNIANLIGKQDVGKRVKQTRSLRKSTVSIEQKVKEITLVEFLID